ncbi:diguanylate cyclase [Hwanghaeella sp.]|uniref:diguanylate cyclase n=1 Tax=Hwanghaeella sp. TaxID=2605943 RepID=UPI003CCBF3A1
MTPPDEKAERAAAPGSELGGGLEKEKDRRGPDRPPACKPQDVLAALDEGDDEVRRFMQAWHRSVICGKPQDRRVTALESHVQTGFGKWMAERSGDALLQQPAFDELTRSHRQIHDQARRLAGIVAEGQPIRTAEYDALINHVSRFYDQARRLRDAFAKLVSEIDPLTGLHNRQIMAHDLDVEFDRGQRTGGPLCLALTDIDHFKRVNDTYGHAAGDVVLASVAGRFQSNLRPYDSIYRYGGEEFLITLPNANTGTANSVLERLRTALESAPIALADGTRLSVTASFGIVRVDYEIPLKQSIERADKALYAAKQGGRNRVVTWSDALEGPAEEVEE